MQTKIENGRPLGRGAPAVGAWLDRGRQWVLHRQQLSELPLRVEASSAVRRREVHCDRLDWRELPRGLEVPGFTHDGFPLSGPTPDGLKPPP
jgi:hypothetical protein